MTFRDSKRIQLYGLAAMIGSVASCGVEGDQIQATDEELLGGTPTSARPAVGQLSLPTHGCSGTLISSRTFVTAAHCIDFQHMLKGGKMNVLGVGTRPIERTFRQGGALGFDDIAFGRLTQPANGITYEAISATEPTSGWLTAIGYGCTTVRGPTCSPSSRTYREFFYTGAASNFIAEGDSGGPWFLGQLNDGGAMIRVHSGYLPDHDVGADVVFYRGHINGMDAALNNDGISYRAAVQDNSWMAAVQNGAEVGKPSENKRLEALQIWSPQTGIVPCYTAFVANGGWQGEVRDGQMAGTYGESRRMEAFKARLCQPSTVPGIVGVTYRTKLYGRTDWEPWVTDNTVSGTMGQSRAILAFQIQLR